MTRTDPANVPRLCPMCRTNVGFWTHEDGLCPTCAAASKKATP